MIATRHDFICSLISSCKRACFHVILFHKLFVAALHKVSNSQRDDLGARGHVIDPYVLIELFGFPPDCSDQRTATALNNSGDSPFFDELFEFRLLLPSLALVRFVVLDDDFIGDEFIGELSVIDFILFKTRTTFALHVESSRRRCSRVLSQWAYDFLELSRQRFSSVALQGFMTNPDLADQPDRSSRWLFIYCILRFSIVRFDLFLCRVFLAGFIAR